MADGIHFEAAGLTDLSRDLKRAAREVRHEVEKTVWKVGAEVAEGAKKIASEHSQTIPATIRMRPIPGAAVISAGSDSVPIAALYELGNKKSSRTAKTFRHPVYGRRDVWVEQPKYPFLRPALSADRPGITRQMNQTWDRALAPYRLRPE